MAEKEEKKDTRKIGEAQKLAREIQRRESLSASLYKALAKRSVGNVAEVLQQVAAEKNESAQSLAKYTGKDSRPSLLKSLGWRILARVFGSSFAISRLEAAEAEARPYFLATADEIPEASQICACGEEHRARLREVLNSDGLRRLGTVMNGLYSAITLLLSTLAGFTALFGQLKEAASAAVCVGVASVLAGMVIGYSSQKTAATRQRPWRAAIWTGIAALLISGVLIAPYFLLGSLWLAFGLSIAAAAVALVFLSYFAAVVRQEGWSGVWAEMFFSCLIAAFIAFGLIYAGTHFFGLHA